MVVTGRHFACTGIYECRTDWTLLYCLGYYSQTCWLIWTSEYISDSCWNFE